MRARRRTRAALITLALSCGVALVATPAPARADDAGPGIADPALVDDIAGAARVHVEDVTPMVAVEVLTSDDDAVAATVAALGGSVTGSVPGQIVQAEVPAARAAALARSAGVDAVQAPRLVNSRPDRQTVEAGFGATVTNAVAGMNATAWQDAGLRGAGVRVGIIDFFTTDQWNVAEQGPLPTVANGHLFCRDSSGSGLCNPDGSINSALGDRHGLATTEIVRDVAPDADVFIATVGTVSDMFTAVDWFADRGITIITRSLGSAFDGPGDGTGPVDSVVDHAAARGITWFNSAGNDAGPGYLRVTVGATERDGTVEVAPGDGLLRLDGDNGCFELDGVRWANDWYLPPAQRTDYRVEVWQPSDPGQIGGLHNNPAGLVPVDLAPSAPGVQYVFDADQRAGAAPLEAADAMWCTASNVSYLRIVRNTATPIGAVPDQLEIASAFRNLEYSGAAAGSAAKPAVDSANPAMVAVGALDSPLANTVASYSSQGPTNDGRIKPDVVAPSCVTSTIYQPCFAGTSASSPAAAGVAALLLGANLAAPGEPLAALVRHLTADIGAPGRDNASGAGKVWLPAAPAAPSPSTPAQYHGLTPTRLLDTRPETAVGPGNLRGAQPTRGIVDLTVVGGNGVPTAGVTAVAVNVTSVNSLTTHYVQALPTLQATIGATSTLNVSVLGAPRPNFAIVPVGVGGQISLYMPTGGDVVVDLLGWFGPASSGPVSAGRFVSIQPERWMDSRQVGILPAGFATPRKLGAGESVAAARPGGTAVPASGVSALVVNVTSDDADGPGFLRAYPTGTQGVGTSTVNYLPHVPSANTAIIPVGPDGTISVFSYASTHAIVDVVGYITGDAAPASTSGLFVSARPYRVYDSRAVGALGTGETRTVGLVGAAVPADASAVSTNLTADQGVAVGFVTVSPAGSPPTGTSNLNYAAGVPVANAALLRVGAGGAVNVFVNQRAHVIIDVNGYFTGP